MPTTSIVQYLRPWGLFPSTSVKVCGWGMLGKEQKYDEVGDDPVTKIENSFFVGYTAALPAERLGHVTARVSLGSAI